MRAVLRLGGHLIIGEDMKPRAGLIAEYAKVIREALRRGHELHVVVGGGPVSRAYIQALAAAGAPRALQDIVGILVSRVNAYLLIAALGELAYPKVPTNADELLEALASGRVVVSGGLQPGQSTVATAAVLAELCGAELLINATTVDGVYTADPRKDPSARRLERVTTGELRRILGARMLPGTYELFDIVALGILERSGIKAAVIDGADPRNVLRLLDGERVGTLILPEPEAGHEAPEHKG